MFDAFLGEGIVGVCEFRYSLDGVDTVDEWDNLHFFSKGSFGDPGVEKGLFAWSGPNSRP